MLEKCQSYHITKPSGRFVYHWRRIVNPALSNKHIRIVVPVSKVPIKFNPTKKDNSMRGQKAESRIKDAQQIRATSQGSSVSNTFCRIVATTANCPTHRKAAIKRDNPTPNLKNADMPILNRIKTRAIPTFTHVSSLLLVIWMWFSRFCILASSNGVPVRI